MKRFYLIPLSIAFLSACEEGVLPKDSEIQEEKLETKCTSEYMQANLTGDLNVNLNALAEKKDKVLAYFSPSGVTISGVENNISIDLKLKYYTGPGIYEISSSNSLFVLEKKFLTSESKFTALSGSIEMEEFLSPTNDTCIKGLFSVECKNLESSETLTITNGEFEASIQ